VIDLAVIYAESILLSFTASIAAISKADKSKI
jgi:hypothetical protein